MLLILYDVLRIVRYKVCLKYNGSRNAWKKCIKLKK